MSKTEPVSSTRKMFDLHLIKPIWKHWSNVLSVQREFEFLEVAAVRVDISTTIEVTHHSSIRTIPNTAD